jgi:hypothetical protein
LRKIISGEVNSPDAFSLRISAYKPRWKIRNWHSHTSASTSVPPMAAGESGAHRDFHNLSFLEYAYIQLGCYRDAQHTVDIIAAQYRELPDKKTAPDTPELQSRHVRGRTIYAVPDRVVYGYFDMLTRMVVESGRRDEGQGCRGTEGPENNAGGRCEAGLVVSRARPASLREANHRPVEKADFATVGRLNSSRRYPQSSFAGITGYGG